MSHPGLKHLARLALAGASAAVLTLGLGCTHAGGETAEAPGAPEAMAATANEAAFASEIRPLFEKYCFQCHSGGQAADGVALDKDATVAAVKADARPWQQALGQLASNRMPPRQAAQPTAEERAKMVAWIRATVGAPAGRGGQRGMRGMRGGEGFRPEGGERGGDND